MYGGIALVSCLRAITRISLLQTAYNITRATRYSKRNRPYMTLFFRCKLLHTCSFTKSSCLNQVFGGTIFIKNLKTSFVTKISSFMNQVLLSLHIYIFKRFINRQMCHKRYGLFLPIQPTLTVDGTPGNMRAFDDMQPYC